MSINLQEYLDKAKDVLAEYNLFPNPENELVQLLNDVSAVDEAKITVIAQTVSYMESFFCIFIHNDCVFRYIR